MSTENEAPRRGPGRPPKPRPSDDWNADTIGLDEQIRLSHCQIPFQTLVQGKWVLREGCDGDADGLINAALDGREHTPANLLLLHRHLKDSFNKGGCSLTAGPLFAEVTHRLRAEGLLPEPPAPRNILAELRAEGRI